MAVGLMVACQSHDSDLAMLQDSAENINDEPTQITEDVNSAELNNVLAGLFGKSTKSRSTDYEIKLLNDSTGSPAIIVVNYSNNNGWALISATKDHYPVLAYNDEGHFELGEDAPQVAKLWLDNSISDVANASELPLDSLATNHLAWRRYEDSNSTKKHLSRAMGHDRLYDISQAEYEVLKKIYLAKMNELRAQGYRVYMIDDYPGTTSFGDDLETFMEGRIYPYYSNDYWAISFVAEKDYYNEILTNGHLLETAWEQENGYNQSFPMLSNGRKAYAGCGPVAVGQIMYYFKHPSTFNWSGMTKKGTANKTTSDFLFNVAEKCNASYHNNGTGCSHKDRKKALEQYGYTSKLVDFSVPNILFLTPAILNCEFKEGGKHAWIVEGCRYSESYTELEIWSFTYEEQLECIYTESTQPISYLSFYVNWGYGGISDGYYGRLDNIKLDHHNLSFKKPIQALVKIRPVK